MSWCRSCQAEIIWARTKAGKPIPLDRDPDPDGNVIFVAPGRVEVIGDRLPVEERFMPHHATCPDAQRWRSK